jgi:hypothetical protein
MRDFETIHSNVTDSLEFISQRFGNNLLRLHLDRGVLFEHLAFGGGEEGIADA